MMDIAAFYDRSYADSLGAHRRYPNEELCRFMGRHYFDVPAAERRRISILEVGCAPGPNLWMIGKEGFDAHGLDFSTEGLRRTQDRLNEAGVKATLHAADMTASNLPVCSFDAVADVFSACVLGGRFPDFIAEARRLLKPGGRLFSLTPHRSTTHLFEDSFPECAAQRWHFTTEHDMVADLARSGFGGVRVGVLKRPEGLEFVVAEGHVLTLGGKNAASVA